MSIEKTERSDSINHQSKIINSKGEIAVPTKSLKYRTINHTADFGLQVFGTDIKELFTNAACAMYDQITDIDSLTGSDEYTIHVTGSDRPDLMVNWLREILYMWTGKEKLIKTVHILSISRNKLSARVKYDIYNPDQHIIKTEIKAVTYHQIEVNQRPDGWESKIIFDV